MFDGFQLCGSFEPIALGEHLIKTGRRHLVVLLPDRALVTSLLGTLHFLFRLVAGRLLVATTVWSYAVHPVVSFWLFYFSGSLGCCCWLHVAHCCLCATHCPLLVVV